MEKSKKLINLEKNSLINKNQIANYFHHKIINYPFYYNFNTSILSKIDNNEKKFDYIFSNLKDKVYGKFLCEMKSIFGKIIDMQNSINLIQEYINLNNNHFNCFVSSLFSEIN